MPVGSPVPGSRYRGPRRRKETRWGVGLPAGGQTVKRHCEQGPGSRAPPPLQSTQKFLPFLEALKPFPFSAWGSAQSLPLGRRPERQVTCGLNCGFGSLIFMFPPNDPQPRICLFHKMAFGICISGCSHRNPQGGRSMRVSRLRLTNATKPANRDDQVSLSLTLLRASCVPK